MSGHWLIVATASVVQTLNNLARGAATTILVHIRPRFIIVQGVHATPSTLLRFEKQFLARTRAQYLRPLWPRSSIYKSDSVWPWLCKPSFSFKCKWHWLLKASKRRNAPPVHLAVALPIELASLPDAMVLCVRPKIKEVRVPTVKFTKRSKSDRAHDLCLFGPGRDGGVT
jgi:hypothetical protein